MRKERTIAVKLRAQGKTYAEIQTILETEIPKATLSYWCVGIKMPKRSRSRIENMSLKNLQIGREKARRLKLEARIKREEFFKETNMAVWETYKTDLASKKIALAVLYIAEGNKRNGSVVFGNSDADIIGMFMSLMRTVYDVNESKFRVTVQCRADQDAEKLKRFWSRITKVPTRQFYNPQFDKRTKDKPTKKTDYKGVCRIDYFSAIIDQELKYVARNLEKR